MFHLRLIYGSGPASCQKDPGPTLADAKRRAATYLRESGPHALAVEVCEAIRNDLGYFTGPRVAIVRRVDLL